MKNKIKKRIPLLVFSVGLVSVLVFIYLLSYKKQQQDTQHKMILITKVRDDTNDFWTSLIEGAEMGAEEYRIDLEVMAPDSEEDIELQIEMVREAIAAAPDLILLAPASYTELTEAAREVKEAGIRLVLVDSFLDQPIYDTAIATNNFEAGTKMGSFMQEELLTDKEPIIGIVSHVQGSSTAIERENGLRSGLGHYQENIVETVFCDSDYEKAYELTRSMMERHPDINYIFGLNEYSAVGAARAIKEMGLGEQVKMVGFDSSIEEIQLLEEGIFSGIVIQKPFAMGYLSVEKAVQVLRGESVPAEVNSGSELITRDNIYTEENQKLLFPFWDK